MFAIFGSLQNPDFVLGQKNYFVPLCRPTRLLNNVGSLREKKFSHAKCLNEDVRPCKLTPMLLLSIFGVDQVEFRAGEAK